VNVIELNKPAGTANDIVAGLRRIADDIEAGEYQLMTSCAVVIGHTSERPGDKPGFTMLQERVEVFGIGPRHDPFTVRGLLMSGVMESASLGSPD
jgi:hypothetical protein